MAGWLATGTRSHGHWVVKWCARGAHTSILNPVWLHAGYWIEDTGYRIQDRLQDARMQGYIDCRMQEYNILLTA